MSKYDDFCYETYSEREKNELPHCVKYSSLNYSNRVPEELIGISVEKLKKILNVKKEDEKDFEFANNNQIKVDRDYIIKGRFFNEEMSPNEKREYLIDYLKFHFGNIVDGKYFEDYLQDIFDLRHYELIAEDFETMIKEYFKKDSFDLNDEEDRENFKRIMFHENIHLIDKNDPRYNKNLNEEIKEAEDEYSNENDRFS